jgi:hypothetical protein
LAKDGEVSMVCTAQRKKAGTFLILALTAGLWLTFAVGPSLALEVCHDYAFYRVSVYENVPPYSVPDANGTTLSGIQAWLANTAKYERVQSPWQVNDESPPPIALKYGDVILKLVGVVGHAAFVNAQGTIDHYLQIYDGPTRERHDPKVFIPSRCPDSSTPLSDNKCGGWRQDRYTGQTVPFCCGLFNGDTWVGFLRRQGDWKGAQFEVWRERDTDKDRVPDWKDKCPSTPTAEMLLIDASGCGPSQRDDDGDGVANDKDACPDTPPAERKLVDAKGCGPSQRDDDGDGVANDKDRCPNTPRGEPVDEYGCSLRQRITLTIDADDPVQAGGVARFTAQLDPATQRALQTMSGALTYDWELNGQPATASTSATLRGTIPQNYDKATLTATVRLVMMTPQGQRIELAQNSRTVQVNKPKTQPLPTESVAIIGPREANQHQNVQFEARPMKTPQSPAYGYRWQMDNGRWDVIAPAQTVTMSFDRDGLHTITLFVWRLVNNKWETVGHAQHTITVRPVGRAGSNVGGR